MTTQDIVETWRQQAIQEGEKRGLEKGVAAALILVYETRFGAVPDDVRGVIEDTHDVPTLRSWIQLVGTSGLDEIVATIRAFRPS